MDLTVRLLRGGPLRVRGIDGETSVEQFKGILHESYSHKAPVPLPEKQRLVRWR